MPPRRVEDIEITWIPDEQSRKFPKHVKSFSSRRIVFADWLGFRRVGQVEDSIDRTIPVLKAE